MLNLGETSSKSCGQDWRIAKTRRICFSSAVHWYIYYCLDLWNVLWPVEGQQVKTIGSGTLNHCQSSLREREGGRMRAHKDTSAISLHEVRRVKRLIHRWKKSAQGKSGKKQNKEITNLISHISWFEILIWGCFKFLLYLANSVMYVKRKQTHSLFHWMILIIKTAPKHNKLLP